MSETHPYILRFHECHLADLPRVGGKNASLGELTRAGFAVPQGFAVTTEAYRAFLDQGPGREIRRLVGEVDPEDLSSLESAEKAIRRRFDSGSIPPVVRKSIEASYRRLGEECGVQDLPVAVRSSATAEDLPGASFAGQQETCLWVRGPEQVLSSTLRCWSSLFTSQAIAYRFRMGFHHDKVLISVGIQKMVNARSAGVLFTLNPANGDPSRIVIEANWGLGESVVKGEVNPDKFVVDKVTLEISDRLVRLKSIEYVVDTQRAQVRSTPVQAERQEIPCLSDDEVVELASLAKRVERHYGQPQDIEWAIDSALPFPRCLALLQSRPETVWSRKMPESPIVAPRQNALEYVLQDLLGRAFRGEVPKSPNSE